MHKATSNLIYTENKTSNHQEEKNYYVPLDPVTDYIYIADLNTRLRVGWKTLPNLNFKLKFQTQISNSKLNFKTKIFPVLPGNPGFWEIDTKGKRTRKDLCLYIRNRPNLPASVVRPSTRRPPELARRCRPCRLL